MATLETLIQSQKSRRIGDVAPDFKADTQLGPVSLYEYLGSSWGILFSHPRDFTPVCTTELGRAAELHDEWAKRNVKVLALSVDTVEHHKQWLQDVEEISRVKVTYPVIADHDRQVSLLYGMLDQSHLSDTGMPFTVRSVFVIGPDRLIKAIISYPAPTGRNFDEILRLIDSLQLAVSHKVATPADWVKGRDTVVLPSVSTPEAQQLFPKGINEVRPWLRITPDPSA